MNDSPMSYDMLRSIAVQVSQELYRQAEAEYASSGPSYRDALAWVRARLAGGRQQLQSSCENLAPTPSCVQQIQS